MTEPTGPLKGLRVFDLTRVLAGPTCSQMLADLGADVIKIEPPAGDPQRGLMNLLARAGGAGANPFVEIPNRGKRSMTLDLAHAEGRALLLELAATADVFLTSYLPNVRARLRIDQADLRAVNPQIVYASGSGWGARGPMANTGGFDHVDEAGGFVTAWELDVFGKLRREIEELLQALQQEYQAELLAAE